MRNRILRLLRSPSSDQTTQLSREKKECWVISDLSLHSNYIDVDFPKHLTSSTLKIEEYKFFLMMKRMLKNLFCSSKIHLKNLNDSQDSAHENLFKL